MSSRIDIFCLNVRTVGRMNDKELQVVQAAHRVFFRYGFARTTMGDIAKEAGLSRPALYLVYPGKVEICRAVVVWMTESMLVTITSTSNADWPLERKLLHAFELSIATLYDKIVANPATQDLLALEGPIPGLEHAYIKLQLYVACLLEGPLKSSGFRATASEIARALVSAIRALKLEATDGKDFRRMMALHIALVCASLGQQPAEMHRQQKRGSVEGNSRRNPEST
jgi:AcrR family transcriptional regulator